MKRTIFQRHLERCLAAVVFLILAGPDIVAAQGTPAASRSALTGPELENFVRARTQLASELLRQGLQFLKENDTARAQQLFEAAIESAPNNNLAYHLLAQLLINQQKDNDAFRTMEKAGRNTSRDIYALLLLMEQRSPESAAPEESLPLVSIAPFKDDKRCAISFNFDDGSRSVYLRGLPIFEEFGFRATIPIVTGMTPEEPVNIVRGSWGDWRDALARGFEIANHSVNHLILPEQPPEVLATEVNASYDEIAEKTGQPPLCYVFPNDQSNLAARRKAAERHPVVRHHETLAKTYDKVFIPVYGGSILADRTAALLVDLAIKKRLWLIPQCHGIETDGLEMYKPITEEFLRRHLAYIKDKEEDIWVDTMGQVFRYLHERKNSQIRLYKRSPNRLSFALVSSLVDRRFSSPLTVIVNVSPLQPRTAFAVEGEDRYLPVRIHGSRIYIEISPNGDPVTVEWE